MKVIDLLNKIANGEEVPEKIKWQGVEFNYINGDYINCNSCSLFRHDVDIYTVLNMLNDEVEIIEEEQDIEELKIGYSEDNPSTKYIINEYGTKCYLTKHSRIMAEKINELIKIVNKLKNKED